MFLALNKYEKYLKKYNFFFCTSKREILPQKVQKNMGRWGKLCPRPKINSLWSGPAKNQLQNFLREPFYVRLDRKLVFVSDNKVLSADKKKCSAYRNTRGAKTNHQSCNENYYLHNAVVVGLLESKFLLFAKLSTFLLLTILVNWRIDDSFWAFIVLFERFNDE